ncbi:hypothetical protein [Aliamphritea ceti]|uniref:hypothetical protein n=1 Tax=Aliamphritea ceti TaxID=1524258 RepID=UPI0021C30A11|nr:hypothetical protein [Aliamphritea ceti]
MGITLLTLSRQHAAGKITTADYRAQRRTLIDEQVFQLEERTMPGLVKECESVRGAVLGDVTQPPPAAYGTRSGNQYSPPVSAMPNSGVQVAAAMASGSDTASGSAMKRLEGLAHPEPAVSKSSGLAKKGLITGLIVGLLVLAGIAYILMGNTEQPSEPVDDPLKQATVLLLENPDWQVADLQAYRQQLSGQTQGLTHEQALLLASVETYLSVPLSNDHSVLDQAVQRLKQDLDALGQQQ